MPDAKPPAAKPPVKNIAEEPKSNELDPYDFASWLFCFVMAFVAAGLLFNRQFVGFLLCLVAIKQSRMSVMLRKIRKAQNTD